MNEYEIFKGLRVGGKQPDGYKKIKVHLVFYVNHDGRHKARLVADEHLTYIPINSVYLGVVSLRDIRLLIFLADINDIETWSTDIGHTYLEVKILDNFYIISGNEFGKRPG